MSLKCAIRDVLKKCGVVIHRYPEFQDPGRIRALMLSHLGIDTVLDIGANVGNYGADLREFGYRARIVSLEPVSESFEQLRRRAQGDPNWIVERLALGETDGTAEINVADTMSSLLRKSTGDNDTLDFEFTKKEMIPVVRLDSVHARLCPTGRTWLKMDVQGFEMQVLDGARESLGAITAVETELSLWAYYEGQTPYREMLDRLESEGFELWSLSGHGAHLQSGRMADCDGIFVRKGESAGSKS